MISGYVISLSADGRSAYKLAVSRFVRLYPARWFSVLFTVAIVTLLSDRTFNVLQVLANLTLLNDYLGFENVDGVYWTLQAELKFYACVFVLVLTGLFNRYHIWLSIWLAATVIYMFTKQPFLMGWFISPSYSSFFIVGVCFFLVQKNGFDAYNLIVLTIASALCAYYAHNQAADYISGGAESDSEIASLIVVAAIVLFVCIAKNLIVINGGKFFFALGALTYPLYLLHNSAGKAVIDSPLLASVSQSYLILGVGCGVTVLSYLVFHYIEQPTARRLRQLLL